MSIVNDHAVPGPRSGMGWLAATASLLRRAWSVVRGSDFDGLDGVQL